MDEDAIERAERRFADLPAPQRRRLVAYAAVLTISLTSLVVVSFYSLPLDGPGRVGLAGGVALAIVSLLVSVAIGLLVVLRSPYPLLATAPVVSGVIALALVSFAAIYLGLSSSDAAAFSEPLDHTGALYFSLTTATTVGFGDISPKSDPARIVVMIQMVADVVVLGFAVRAVLQTARRQGNAS